MAKSFPAILNQKKKGTKKSRTEPVRPPEKIDNAPWLTAPPLQTIFSILNDKEEQARVVGGAVRNHLFNRPIHDIDIAVKLPPEEVVKRAQKAGLKTIPTGIKHGTVTLICQAQSFEVTTLRRDIETDGRHAKVKFGTSWQEDAARRDFTINALYLSADGHLHDPLGTGWQDCSAKHVRFIGEPTARIKEDHLRILRYYRFAAHYQQGPLDQAAISATIQQRAGLAHLSKERIHSEVIKLLSAEHLGPVISQLYQNGLLLQILGTAPNITLLEKLTAIEANLNLDPDPTVRLGMLAAYHEGDVKRLAKRLALSNHEQATLALCLSAKPFDRWTTHQPDEHTHKVHHYQMGREAYLTAFIASWARSGHAPSSKNLHRLYQTAGKWPELKFPITGKDLLAKGVQPGPKLGQALSDLERHWLANKMQPNRSELLKKFKENEDKRKESR